MCSSYALQDIPKNVSKSEAVCSNLQNAKLKKKLRGFSLQANYTDWETVACQRS
jgi:hypothetical protein